MLFHFSIFLCNPLRVVPLIVLPLHDLHEFTRPLLQMVCSLSCIGRPCCCSATSTAASNKTTGRGVLASYMGCPLPCAPGSVGRKPCGQGSPHHRPDGAGQLRRVKVVDEEDDVDDDELEDHSSSSSVRWVLRSGTLVCVVCGLGPFGPLAPLVPTAAHCGRVPGLPLLFQAPPDLGIHLAPTLDAGPNVSRASS
jgi:hypothetical protein